MGGRVGGGLVGDTAIIPLADFTEIVVITR